MAMSQEQLELPLFLWLDENVDETQWTEESVNFLREVLLFDGLKTVCGIMNRSSQKEKDEIWMWITDDSQGPFSFKACAEAVGVDPDDLRVAFARMAERDMPRANREKVEKILEHYLEEPRYRREEIKAITAQW